MKKWFLMFVLIVTGMVWAQEIEINYTQINEEFQSAVGQLFQNFINQQKSQGNEVVVTLYDNRGNIQTQVSTSQSPTYLQVISNTKMLFLKNKQLYSTKGVWYQGCISDQ